MRFLRTLFWIVVAVLITLFAAQNWRDVTVDLWGNLQADIKLPLLLLVAILCGFLPTWLIYRAKLWRLQNRMAAPRQDLRPPEANATEESE